MDPEASNSSVSTGPSAPTPLAQAGRFGGTLLGLAVGYYAGMTLLIPAGFATVIGIMLSKFAPSRKSIIPPAAIVAGHISWMILGCVILGNWAEVLPVLPEIVILGGAAFWLLARPKLLPIAVLAILELLEFCYSAHELSQQSFGTPMHKARLVHASLYLMAGILLVQAFIKLRKEKAATQEATS